MSHSANCCNRSAAAGASAIVKKDGTPPGEDRAPEMNADRISGFFWLAFVAYFIYHSTTLYGLGTLSEPGTGFFPFLSGCFVALMAILVLVQSFSKHRPQVPLSSLWQGKKWHRTITVSILVLCYLLTFERIGFFLTTMLFLFTICTWVQEYSRWKSIFISVVAATLANLLFHTLLKASLPQGILGF